MSEKYTVSLLANLDKNSVPVGIDNRQEGYFFIEWRVAEFELGLVEFCGRVVEFELEVVEFR